MLFALNTSLFKMYPGQFFCIFMLLHLSFGSADQCGVNIISTDVADETPQSFIFSGPTIIADVKVMNPYIYQLTGLKCCANIYQKPNYKGQIFRRSISWNFH